MKKHRYFALLIFVSLLLLSIQMTKNESTWAGILQEISPGNTIGLETYVSKENGYAIKYPSYTEVKEFEVNKIKGIEILGPKIFIESRRGYPAYQLRVIVRENPDKLSAKNWAQRRLIQEWKRTSTSNVLFIGPIDTDGKIDESLVIDIQVNGLPAYQERWEGRDFSVIHTYIANEDKIYELVYEDYPIAAYSITEVAKGICLMMLSTFEIMPLQKTESIEEQEEHEDNNVVLEEEKKPDTSIQKPPPIVPKKSDTVSVGDKQKITTIVSPKMEKTGIVLGSGVRVRDKPTVNNNSQIVFKLSAGDKIEILDRTKTRESFSKTERLLLDGGYHWYKVKRNNKIGWLYGEFLKMGDVPSGVSVVKINLYSQSVWYSESFGNSEEEGGKDVTEYYVPLRQWSYHKTYIPMKYDICAYLLNNSNKTARNMTLELGVYYLSGKMTDNLSIPKDANWIRAHTFSRKVKSLSAGRLVKVFVKGVDFESDYQKLVTSNDSWLWKVKVETKVQVSDLQSQPYQSEIMITHGD